MSGIAYLIGKTFTSDDVGNRIPTETRRMIFTEEQSVTRQEWADAGRRGLNPAFLLMTDKVNYNGEDEVEYNDKRYGIYRTYERGDVTELYLERKGGLE